MNVYSSLKLFHFPEKLASLAREEAITAPVHIRWKPTNRCNHRCRYCAYRQDSLQLGQHMRNQDEVPREKMLEIAKDIVDMGVKAVTFSGGGEPLCYPFLLEAAEMLYDGGVKLAALTNGALLSGKLAEFFSSKAVWVRISMDGWDDASYSKYRGVKDGEYSRIMKNIADFIQLGGQCALGVSLIIDAENAPHVYATLGRLKEAGVKSVKASACVISNSGVENNAYHAPHLALVQAQIDAAFEKFADDSFTIADAWHTLETRFEKNYDWCPCIQIKPVIAADCKLYPCQDKAYNNTAILGDLKTHSFQELWSRSKENFFRIKPCTDCNHHCVVNDKNMMIIEYLGLDKGHMDFI